LSSMSSFPSLLITFKLSLNSSSITTDTTTTTTDAFIFTSITTHPLDTIHHDNDHNYDHNNDHNRDNDHNHDTILIDDI